MLVKFTPVFRFPMPAAARNPVNSVWGDHVSYFITFLHGSMEMILESVWIGYEH